MIIFITFEYFAPAFKAGGPIQSLDNLVNNLKEENVQIFVCCSNKDLDGTHLTVIPDTWQQYNTNTKVYYATSKNCKTGIVPRLLKEIKPDIIFINGLFSRYFSLQPLSYKHKARKILSVRGMLHPGALSQKSVKKKIFLQAFKLRRLHQKCEFHATTEEEAVYINENFGRQTKVWVVPNFPKIIGYQQPLEKTPGYLSLLSIALISPMKNIKLVLEALAQCNGNIRYDIYGPVKDQLYWQECKEVMKALPSNIQIAYKGSLEPHQVADTLRRYHVMVQPSKSENFGHSIFEAFSAGKPVVTSRFTPWNSLHEHKAGYNVDLDSTTTLVKSIEELVSFNDETYLQWTQHAWSYAMDKVNLPAIKAGYKKMFGIA